MLLAISWFFGRATSFYVVDKLTVAQEVKREANSKDVLQILAL